MGSFSLLRAVRVERVPPKHGKASVAAQLFVKGHAGPRLGVKRSIGYETAEAEQMFFVFDAASERDRLNTQFKFEGSDHDD